MFQRISLSFYWTTLIIISSELIMPPAIWTRLHLHKRFIFTLTNRMSTGIPLWDTNKGRINVPRQHIWVISTAFMQSSQTQLRAAWDEQWTDTCRSISMQGNAEQCEKLLILKGLFQTNCPTSSYTLPGNHRPFWNVGRKRGGSGSHSWPILCKWHCFTSHNVLLSEQHLLPHPRAKQQSCSATTGLARGLWKWPLSGEIKYSSIVSSLVLEQVGTH